jgi:hypothetical protein
MASQAYPTHDKTCACSGCYLSNLSKETRNDALEEAALACAANPTWTGRNLAIYLRALKG